MCSKAESGRGRIKLSIYGGDGVTLLLLIVFSLLAEDVEGSDGNAADG